MQFVIEKITSCHLLNNPMKSVQYLMTTLGLILEENVQVTSRIT
ncbi:hypothetical protein HMPREF9999_01467 [Alloprevotella sp. oral taxon 473 str. F0040]|nr:hypothetical protein HMPREF9999_01467 [Alloprevotella sp. oral taxon 473 str. F0040]